MKENEKLVVRTALRTECNKITMSQNQLVVSLLVKMGFDKKIIEAQFREQFPDYKKEFPPVKFEETEQDLFMLMPNTFRRIKILEAAFFLEIDDAINLIRRSPLFERKKMAIFLFERGVTSHTAFNAVLNDEGTTKIDFVLHCLLDAGWAAGALARCAYLWGFVPETFFAALRNYGVGWDEIKNLVIPSFGGVGMYLDSAYLTFVAETVYHKR